MARTNAHSVNRDTVIVKPTDDLLFLDTDDCTVEMHTFAELDACGIHVDKIVGANVYTVLKKYRVTEEGFSSLLHGRLELRYSFDGMQWIVLLGEQKIRLTSAFLQGEKTLLLKDSSGNLICSISGLRDYNYYVMNIIWAEKVRDDFYIVIIRLHTTVVSTDSIRDVMYLYAIWNGSGVFTISHMESKNPKPRLVFNDEEYQSNKLDTAKLKLRGITK